MGTTTAFTDDQVSNLIDGSGSATYTLTAKNGDTLVLALVVQPGGTINVEGGVLFSGSYTITGGTGRFSGATGSGIFGGTGLFLTETDGIGAFAVVGTISCGKRFELGSLRAASANLFGQNLTLELRLFARMMQSTHSL